MTGTGAWPTLERREVPMKPWILILIFVIAAGAAVKARAQEKPLEVVPSVDIQRYLGTWYEIANVS